MVAAKDQLARRAGWLLAGLAGQLDDVTTPVFNPKFTKVAGFNVISGVDIGSEKLLDGPARTITESPSTITGIAGNLELLSASMREVSDILGTVGAALAGLGERLSGTGKSVSSLAG